MIYVLDTHVLYWYLFEPDRLSVAARRAVTEGEAGEAILNIPTVVLAELYFLLRKVGVDSLFPEVVKDLQENPNCRIEPMILEDVVDLGRFPEVPEMHDRLIAASSNRLGATLITKDGQIQASPQVAWIW